MAKKAKAAGTAKAAGKAKGKPRSQAAAKEAAKAAAKAAAPAPAAVAPAAGPADQIVDLSPDPINDRYLKELGDAVDTILAHPVFSDLRTTSAVCIDNAAGEQGGDSVPFNRRDLSAPKQALKLTPRFP